MENKQSKNWYEIGSLDRGTFRSLLKRCKFVYSNLEWEEDKGFFFSVFYVKGNLKALQELNKIVKSWQ